MTNNTNLYESPEIEVLSVAAEHAFCGSGDGDGFGNANQAGDDIRESYEFLYDL